MDLEQERRDLAEAERHISDGERRIAEQENRIYELARKGRDTRLAKDLLMSLRQSVELHYAHRVLILAALKQTTPG